MARFQLRTSSGVDIKRLELFRGRLIRLHPRFVYLTGNYDALIPPLMRRRNGKKSTFKPNRSR
jgi:hypothetical protein